jgi:hypothetical protein
MHQVPLAGAAMALRADLPQEGLASRVLGPRRGEVEPYPPLAPPGGNFSRGLGLRSAGMR